ncbi:MAG TPA: diguanylate cyclase [Kofleriaceae bacterium]|nr:diguanylate cyclase [Kofleriaceae bacterium]
MEEGTGRVPDAERLLAVIALQSAILALRRELDDVLHLASTRALSLLPATGAVVEIFDGEELRIRAASGAAAGTREQRLHRDASLSGLAVMTRAVQRSDDAAHDDRVDRALCARMHATSVVCAPVLHFGTALGVFKVVSSERAAFSDEDVSLVAVLADVVAAAVVYAQHVDAERASRFDDVTGLSNRRGLDEKLALELERRRRYGDPLAVAFAELEPTDPTTADTSREVAALLRGCIRSIDAAFRIGGDTFAIVFPNTSAEAARVPVARFVDAVTRARLGAGVTVGVVEATGDSPSDLIADAEAALQAAKRGDAPA